MFVNSLAAIAQKMNVAVNYVTTDGAKNNNTIFYRAGQSLNWGDFKGTPVNASDAVALTNAGFGVKLLFRSVENRSSQLVISVSCSFSRKDSWVKTGNKNDYILNHEQKHFDLAFIHTQLFIRNLRKADFTNANYAGLIEKIYNQTAAELTDIQDKYDLETSHSRIPKKQGEWDEKISTMLSSALKE
ncbi:MAG: hypothetical protein ABIN94_04390 [Ferruginibacter sp.]